MRALELNDAALTLVDGSGLRRLEPGYALVTGGEMRFGLAAARGMRLHPRQALLRHWADPAAVPMPGAPVAAALVSAHLRDLLADDAATPVVLALPPHWQPPETAAFLQIAQQLGVPVTGSADAAVAATRSAYPGRELVHLEASLHGFSMTRLSQADTVTWQERELLPGPGVEGLQRLCAEFIARRFIECSRFDPLHDAATEQLLWDQLPGWLQRLQGDGEVVCELLAPAGRFTATVSSRQLKSRVALVCEPLLQRLRAGVASRGPVALQLHHRLARHRALRPPVPGAAASAAPDLALPLDQAPVTAAAGSATLTLQQPTHLLWDARAWRLDDLPFTVGTGLGDDDVGIRLDPAAPGVSRRHCTLRVENGLLMVFDHSRYGTFLNGHRMEHAAVLEVGDTITLGSPPVTLRLIGEVDAATASRC
jgi:FHA domain